LLSLKRNLIKKLEIRRRFDGGKLKNENTKYYEFSAEYLIIENEQNEESRKKVVNALNQLPEKQKEAIYLRFNEALDYPEIAIILGISIESVRKQVCRAIKNVRELLDSKSKVILFHFFQKKVE